MGKVFSKETCDTCHKTNFCTETVQKIRSKRPYSDCAGYKKSHESEEKDKQKLKKVLQKITGKKDVNNELNLFKKRGDKK